MFPLTGTTRTALCLLSVVLVQGCATSARFCANYVETAEYQEAPDFKVIAQYFDRKSQKPPQRREEIPNECWFLTEADSMEIAEQSILEACNDSLRELDKFTKWHCVVVARGPEITLDEQLRMVEFASKSYSRTSNTRTTSTIDLTEERINRGPASREAPRSRAPKEKKN